MGAAGAQVTAAQGQEGARVASADGKDLLKGFNGSSHEFARLSLHVVDGEGLHFPFCTGCADLPAPRLGGRKGCPPTPGRGRRPPLAFLPFYGLALKVLSALYC